MLIVCVFRICLLLYFQFEEMKQYCVPSTAGDTTAYTLIDKLFVRQFLVDYSWGGKTRKDQAPKKCFKQFQYFLNFFLALVQVADDSYGHHNLVNFFQVKLLPNSKRRAVEEVQRAPRVKCRAAGGPRTNKADRTKKFFESLDTTDDVELDNVGGDEKQANCDGQVLLSASLDDTLADAASENKTKIVIVSPETTTVGDAIETVTTKTVTPVLPTFGDSFAAHQTAPPTETSAPNQASVERPSSSSTIVPSAVAYHVSVKELKGSFENVTNTVQVTDAPNSDSSSSSDDGDYGYDKLFNVSIF